MIKVDDWLSAEQKGFTQGRSIDDNIQAVTDRFYSAEDEGKERYLLLLDFNPDHLAADLNGLGVVDVEVGRAGPGGDGEAGGCWSIVVMCRSPESVTSL